MTHMINGAKLREALLAVKRTISKDETRPHLSVALLELGANKGAIGAGTLRMCSTDGHRLALYCVTGANADHDNSWEGDITTHLSGDDVAAALRAIPKKYAATTVCDLTVAGSVATLKIGSTTLTLRGLDGSTKFPPYLQVVPTIDAGPFAGVGLNPRYLADACDAVAEIGANGLCFKAAGPLDPIRVDAQTPELGALTFVIMPMRQGGAVDSDWTRASATWTAGARAQKAA